MRVQFLITLAIHLVLQGLAYFIAGFFARSPYAFGRSCQRWDQIPVFRDSSRFWWKRSVWTPINAALHVAHSALTMHISSSAPVQLTAKLPLLRTRKHCNSNHCTLYGHQRFTFSPVRLYLLPNEHYLGSFRDLLFPYTLSHQQPPPPPPPKFFVV